MKLKKKDALILVGALSCLFFLLSFSLVFELEDIGYREQIRRHRAEAEEAQARGDAPQHMSWINDFFQPRCRCPKFKTHGFQGSIDAHELAVHTTFDHDTCYVARNVTLNHEVDIQVGDLLREARLRYPQYLYHHTGWIQEMDVTYSPSRWQHQPLRVFFVLHSHNDPGWLYTYTQYFTSWTRATLDRAVKFLDNDPELKFVWAEVIYLQQWYNQATSGQRRQLKRLVRNGQFEVLTGGWVMTDEATAHYGAMLEQLLNGHEWLANTLDVTPQYGWAIDPFGHSSTMTYLLKRSGLEGNVLQRMHYAVKRHLAYNKQLEFYWRQTWDDGGADTGLLSHALPFFYYNIPYSCGPDIQTCCRLDFHSNKCWAWGKYQQPQPVTDQNVHQLAVALLDQLRKKAEFYKHDVLLVPHGDDFRYSSDREWTNQTENLKKLFAYMNNQPDMRVQMEFGTVADYFKAVKSSGAAPLDCTKPEGCPKAAPKFPSLSGDFFTYTDRDDQYWSGYYTSRPFLKSAIRQLEAKLRSTEILFTLGHAYTLRKSRRLASDIVASQFRSIEGIRDTLGLLQHHDAVTGTARHVVTADYLSRARTAIDDAEGVTSFLLNLLLHLVLDPTADPLRLLTPPLDMVEHTVVSIPPEFTKLPDEERNRVLIVHNPLTVERTDVISLTVTSPDVTVTNIQGHSVQCQVGPVWEQQTHISDQKFELTVEVTVPPLGIARYLIKPTDYNTGCPRATLRVFNSKPATTKRNVFHLRHYSVLDTPVSIETRALQATICMCTGLLKAVTNKMDGTEHQTEVHVVTYGTGSWKNPYKDKSGAYVFMPDGAAQEVQYENPVVVVIEGPLLSSIKTDVPLLTQKITLWNTTGKRWFVPWSHQTLRTLSTEELCPLAAAIHLENTVNLVDEKNLEVAVRIISDVMNDDHVFHTDLNGFQMSRRETLSRLPLQGNFYPVTTAMFLEDELFRLTALTAQSHGAASLHPGWMEFILDRELEQDDWRGLNEGVKDNQPTTSQFMLLWETRRLTSHDHHHTQQSHDHQKHPDEGPASMGFLSLLGHLSSQILNNPMRLRIQRDKGPNLTPVVLEPLNQPLPCDLHLLNLRSYSPEDPDVRSLLILHRLTSDCNFPEAYMYCKPSGGRVRWTELFSQVRISSVEKTSLTGTRYTQKLHHSFLSVHPMEISTFKVVLS